MRRMLTFALGCLAAFSLYAKEKVQIKPDPSWLYKVNPDLQKVPDSRDISDGYYYSLLEEQVSLPASTEYTHYIKQIINESGVQKGSEVSINFAPQFQELVIHRITITRDGEVINQLQADRIKVVQEETDAADFTYNGLKRAYVTLKDVRKGDRIEVSYSLIGFNPVFGHQYSDNFYFAQETAICNYFKVILSPADRVLNIRTFENAPQPRIEHEGQSLIYHWDNPPLKTWENHSHSPSWYHPYPSVTVTGYANWQEVVNWGLNTFKNYNYPLPEGLNKKIAAWQKTAAGDHDVFTELAIDFVQDEVRYLGEEIGPNTHQPHPPADVFTHRFGDCKDKALLLTSILRKAGISAYVALISTTTRDKLPSSATSPLEFNHAIVAIERSKDVFIYIDATISGQRGSLINRYVPAYGYALILREGEKELRPVEPGTLYNYSIEEYLKVRYYDSSRYSVITTYSGGAADNIRSNFAETSAREIEQNYHDYYAKLFDGIAISAPITSSDDSLKNEFVVKEAWAIPHLWNNTEKGKQSFDFTAKVFTEFLPAVPTAAEQSPLALSFPRSVDYTLKIEMPENWQFNVDELHIKNASYQFDFVPTVTNNLILLSYHYKSFKDNISPEALSQYKTDHKEIADRVSFQLYKETGTTDNPSSGHSPSPAPGLLPVMNTKPHWQAIWIAFFFAVFFTALFKRLNRRSEEVEYMSDSAWPLGGWTIVLGITIALTLVMDTVYLVKSSYLFHATWVALPYFLSLLFGIAGAGSLLYWFIGRRDIFPRMFTWYVGILLSAHLFRILSTSLTLYPYGSEGIKETLNTQFIRLLIYAGIWVTYLKRSERVKSTFLLGYRD